MLNRNEMKEYALKICVPMMERTARRSIIGEMAYKADQVGFVPSMLENFCRPFWGIAPIIAQGENIVLTVGNKQITVLDYMRTALNRGLSHGNDYSWDINKEYFDDYVYENQNITELAGLLVGVYFAQKQLWNPLSENEKQTVATELYNIATVAFDHSWPNNHYWFPILTVTVLKRLGFIFERTEQMLETGLDFLDGLYIGNGWYKDGEFGRFDYYEAWSLHLYPLLWTLIADSGFKNYEKRKKIYTQRTDAFLDFYTHWFDSHGANVPFGRSLSYRFAAAAIFPVAVLAGCRINPALAGRITAMNIEFFKNNYKNEESDILAPGYLYQSPSIVEGYTSDGGAYWCCKTFLALMIEEDNPFWDYADVKIPSEKSDYCLLPDKQDIHMIFEANDGIVTMYNNTAQYYLNGVQTHKFGSLRDWYGKFAYCSAIGFGCSSSDNVAIDNMVSLITPDLSMTSHRLGFDDLGYSGGVLHSIHIPFSNNTKSKIETWIIPLGGIHVRVHRVFLANQYYVCEGGFSLPRRDDYLPKESGKDYMILNNHQYFSGIKTVSFEKIKFSVSSAQAGFHLYAPLSACPMYCTAAPLKKGVYVFASAFYVAENKIDDESMPQIKIMSDCVEIKYKEQKFTVSF